MRKDPETSPPQTSQGENSPSGTFTVGFQLPGRCTSSVALARPVCALCKGNLGIQQPLSLDSGFFLPIFFLLLQIKVFVLFCFAFSQLFLRLPLIYLSLHPQTMARLTV